jgi:hypothetical protein
LIGALAWLVHALHLSSAGPPVTFDVPSLIATISFFCVGLLDVLGDLVSARVVDEALAILLLPVLLYYCVR